MGQALEMADCVGVPEFFATHIKVEDAGCGCLRIYGCTIRLGILVPVYSVVFPTSNMLTASRAVEEMARRAHMAESTAH